MIMGSKSFAIRTLGCKVNQCEEETMREGLFRLGFAETDPTHADAVIINSCTVTHQADSKTRNLVRRIKRMNPAARIFVTGCYTVMKKDRDALEAMPEVYMAISGRDKESLPAVIRDSMEDGDNPGEYSDVLVDTRSRTRAFLKIQDGCDQDCSYCKVTVVRGPSRSRGMCEVMDAVRKIVDGGYREFVLTGICLGGWKGDAGETLPDLLRDIDRLEGAFRVRISSIEPNHVDDKLISVIADSGKICHQLHIPLQSGSDRVLEAMNRKYTVRDYKSMVERLRLAIPLAGVTMDVIAGFPGETERDFEDTVTAIREIRPSRLHVFRYSERSGTQAVDLEGKVPSVQAKSRVEKLIEEGRLSQLDFCKCFEGKEIEVLFEGEEGEGSSEGYSGEYVRTMLKRGDMAVAGELLRVRIDSVDIRSFGLIGHKSSDTP